MLSTLAQFCELYAFCYPNGSWSVTQRLESLDERPVHRKGHTEILTGIQGQQDKDKTFIENVFH